MQALALALALFGAAPPGPAAAPASAPVSPAASPAARAPATAPAPIPAPPAARPAAPAGPAAAPVMVVPLPAAAPLPLPFPAPHAIAASPDLRSDLGTVQAVDATRGIRRCTTTAGVVTSPAPPTVRVTDREGKVLGGLEHVAVGGAVRVYYIIAQGAVLGEIALQ